jgi:carboxylesterase type B
MPWGPTIDGSSHGLLRRPIVSIRRGAWNKVPLIIGTNNDEGTIFVPIIFLVVPGTHFPLQEADFTPVLMHFFDQNASLVAAVERVYPNDGTLKPDARAGAILRDCFFACPSRRVARALSDQVTTWHFTFALNRI